MIISNYYTVYRDSYKKTNGLLLHSINYNIILVYTSIYNMSFTIIIFKLYIITIFYIIILLNLGLYYVIVNFNNFLFILFCNYF